jgi:dethiobiotin synthetase
MKDIFVTGIGTDIGKTLVSAILTEALEADYWKPVQSGSTELTDSQKVKSLLTNTRTVFHPEAYLLEAPLSPHAAAALEGKEIDLARICRPQTANRLVVEGAGGLFVPLNQQHLIVDLIQHLQLPVVVVSAHYLGSINHTLLTLEALRSRQIPVLGLIFNGEPNPASEEFILRYSGLPKLLSVLPEATVTPAVIRKYADQLSMTIDPLPNVLSDN